MHLRCLFVISKNRNADVTNKFFQLKIVDYFTHEIQLEHEVAEKVYKLNQFNNNKNDKNLKINSNINKTKNKVSNLNNREKNENIKISINNEKESKNKGIVKKLDLGKLNLLIMKRNQKIKVL